MTTIGTLFSGFGGVDIGARAAGLELAWGLELDPAIADVAHANLGHDIHIGSILDADPRTFERVDVLHASPPCPSFSVAKAGGVETALDIALSRKTAEFITVLQPRIVTLENVWAYRHSKSWRVIENALHKAGYWVSVEHCNSADFGGLKACPFHELRSTAEFAPVVGSNSGRDSQMGIASGIVRHLAEMQPVAQAMHLALIAVAHLVKATEQDYAAGAALRATARMALTQREQVIQDGRVDAILTTADMFVSGLTDGLDANIVLLLRKCLDAPFVSGRWCIISTETKRIMIRLILQCIQATKPTYQNITRKGKWSIPIGALGTNGIDVCPLCHYEAVPQTRKRMIVRAIKGGFVPYMPEPVPWVGWYAAIEDLLPTLPESQFAPWQLARLPSELTTCLVAQGGYDGLVTTAKEQEPSFTVTANHNQLGLKAFLMPGGGNTNFAEASPGKGVRFGDEPSHTVTTITQGGGTMPRAFLMQVQGEGGDGLLYDTEPMQTVTSNHGAGKYRAWLVDGGNSSKERIERHSSEPSLTVITGGAKHPLRALLSTGRVVSMTPRCLARFQSFPDDYELPDNSRLAAKGIGNAVPPLMMQRIYEGLEPTP